MFTTTLFVLNTLKYRKISVSRKKISAANLSQTFRLKFAPIALQKKTIQNFPPNVRLFFSNKKTPIGHQ